jgi:hypothetical protein
MTIILLTSGKYFMKSDVFDDGSVSSNFYSHLEIDWDKVNKVVSKSNIDLEVESIYSDEISTFIKLNVNGTNIRSFKNIRLIDQDGKVYDIKKLEDSGELEFDALPLHTTTINFVAHLPEQNISFEVDLPVKVKESQKLIVNKEYVFDTYKLTVYEVVIAPSGVEVSFEIDAPFTPIAATIEHASQKSVMYESYKVSPKQNDIRKIKFSPIDYSKGRKVIITLQFSNNKEWKIEIPH